MFFGNVQNNNKKYGTPLTDQVWKMQSQMMAMMSNPSIWMGAATAGSSGKAVEASGETGIEKHRVIMNPLENEENIEINITDTMQNEVNSYQKAYVENKERYLKVADELLKKDGITNASPEKRETLALFVATIHRLEAGNKFDRYLHNGEKLGKETQLVPKGVYFGEDQWEEAAADALKDMPKEILTAEKVDMSKLMSYAEKYNGMGYKNKGLHSPYVWGGTNLATKGRYVADHVFDKNAMIKRPGVYVLMKSMEKQPGSLSTQA